MYVIESYWSICTEKIQEFSNLDGILLLYVFQSTLLRWFSSTDSRLLIARNTLKSAHSSVTLEQAGSNQKNSSLR